MTSVPDAVRSQRKLDTEKLQEVVVRLQEQLTDARRASRRLEGQLNCLLLLVRKAWTGDYEASEKVAQVVAVPPPIWTNINDPELINKQPPDNTHGDEESHWRSEAVEASQILYFRERLGHLNALQSQHNNLMTGYGRQVTLRPPRPVSAKKQPKIMRLRRSNSASSLGRNAEFHGDYLRWRDVIGQPETTNHYSADEDPSRVNPAQNSRSLGPEATETEVRPTYLFDATDVVMPFPNMTDVTTQRIGDDVRSRPKSSSIRHDSGRPMKFETTRPVSNHLTAKPPSSRPSSGKPASVSSRQGWPRKAMARRPPSVDRFSSDESAMHEMERNFEATVVDLQRRLGIDDSGIVY